jgi:hypothetical protein
VLAVVIEERGVTEKSRGAESLRCRWDNS